MRVLRRGRSGLEQHRLLRTQEPARERRRERLRTGDQPGDDLLDGRISDVHRAGGQHLVALVGHADHRGIGVEQVDHGPRDAVQGRLQRQALGEGLRHRVEAAELAGGQPLGLEGALEDLRELLGALVQARVLDGDRELPGERQEQALLPFPVRAGPPPVDGEGSDRLVADEERDEERPAGAAFLDDALEPREARVGPQVLDEEEAAAAERAERQLQEPLGELLMRAAEIARRAGDETALVAQVHGDLPARGQLGDSLDRDLERVRQRELGDRLAHDRDERLRAPERRLDLGGVAAAAQRERRSRAER